MYWWVVGWGGARGPCGAAREVGPAPLSPRVDSLRASARARAPPIGAISDPTCSVTLHFRVISGLTLAFCNGVGLSSVHGQCAFGTRYRRLERRRGPGHCRYCFGCDGRRASPRVRVRRATITGVVPMARILSPSTLMPALIAAGVTILLLRFVPPVRRFALQQ